MRKTIIDHIIKYCEDKQICDKLQDFGDFYNKIKDSDHVTRETLMDIVKYCEYEQIYDKLTLYGNFYYSIKTVLRK